MKPFITFFFPSFFPLWLKYLCCVLLLLLASLVGSCNSKNSSRLLYQFTNKFFIIPFCNVTFFWVVVVVLLYFSLPKIVAPTQLFNFFSLTHFCTLSLISFFVFAFQHFYFIYALCCVISFGSFDFLIYNFVCAARSYSSASTHRFFSALARKRVFAGRRHSSVCFSVCVCVCVFMTS